MGVKIILGLISIIGYAFAQSTFQTEMQKVADANDVVGLSVLGVCNGQIIDQFYYGQSDISRGVSVSEKTRYRVASVSKHVATIGLMQLYEQGKFKLDDDISTALGFQLKHPLFPSTPITYRMILSHQSSLGESNQYDDFIGTTYNMQTTPFPEVKELLQPGGKWYSTASFTNKKPGTYFSYSNINFGLVGILVEAHSGQRFDVYMKQNVFMPLGIGASYNVQDIADIGNLAVIYRKSVAQTDDYGGKMPLGPDLSHYKLGTNAFRFGPQGSLRISAAELAKISGMMANLGTFNGTQILSSQTVITMRSTNWLNNGSNGDTDANLFQAWGLGSQLITASPGKDLIFPDTIMFGHAGDAYGLISDIFTDPSTGYAAIFITNGPKTKEYLSLSNTSAFYQVEEQSFKVLDQYSRNKCKKPNLYYTAQVISKQKSPLLSYIDGTAVYQQVFNPTWVQASQGTNNKQGLLVRTQNCTSDVGDKCTFCGGAQDKASILTFSEDLKNGSFSKITTQSEVFGPSDSSDSWGTEDPRMAFNPKDNLYYMFYTAYNGSAIFLSLATSANPTDPNGWTKHGPVFPKHQNSKSAALLLRESGPHYLLWGDSDIRIAQSNDPLNWPDEGQIFISPRPDFFDSKLVESGPPPMKLSNGDYIFFYNSASTGWPDSPTSAYHVGWLVLDGSNPMNIKARSSQPLLAPVQPWEMGKSPYTCNAPNVVFLEAAYPLGNDQFRVFFGGADATIGTADIQINIPTTLEVTKTSIY